MWNVISRHEVQNKDTVFLVVPHSVLSYIYRISNTPLFSPLRKYSRNPLIQKLIQEILIFQQLMVCCLIYIVPSPLRILLIHSLLVLQHLW